VDHAEAGALMKGSGRGWLAAAIAAIAIVGATAASRIGPAAPTPATAGSASSTTWLCPHGGGPGWTGTIAIANPGDTPVEANVTSFVGRDHKEFGQIDVPAHGEILRQVPASERDASTRVDIFGGWAAVGWTVWSGGKESGLGAEPCTSQPGASWSVVDGVTNRNSHPFLVVMNPFTADAVIDVALFLQEKPPVRSDAWTDLPIDAGSSVALDLGAKKSGALGEPIVGAQITATVGRVAASSLSVHQGGGIRSVLATPALSNSWVLPTTGVTRRGKVGSVSGTVSVLVPGEAPIRYEIGQLAADDGSHGGGSSESRQAGASASSSQIGTYGPAAILVHVSEGGPIAAALREDGARADEGATGGAATPAGAWVVLPMAFGIEPGPSLVLVNEGDAEVSATLTLLHEGGGSLGDTMEVSVPAGATAGVAGKFLRQDHTAAVLVAADGPLVALGAGTAGSGDAARYAMAIGVPIPAGVLPAGP
jgi:hypothetical protein